MLSQGTILQRTLRQSISLAERRRPTVANRAARDLKTGATRCSFSVESPLTADAAVASAPCRLYDVRDKCIPYHTGWDWQHSLADEMKKDPEVQDALILLEHEPVYTLGTASKLEYVLFEAEALRRGQQSDAGGTDTEMPMLVRTERGGEVTYHGPGQLVVYPILNLNRHKKDLHWYLRSLEDVVINMLGECYGLEASRKKGLTGVWVGDEKVCAMGLKVSKWITMHGLALNVTTDLAPFERIVPCGISKRCVSSVQHLVNPETEVAMDSAREHFVSSFIDVFGPYDMSVTQIS